MTFINRSVCYCVIIVLKDFKVVVYSCHNYHNYTSGICNKQQLEDRDDFNCVDFLPRQTLSSFSVYVDVLFYEPISSGDTAHTYS